MNVKPGDMAIIVSSFCGNEGKIVTCIRLATSIEIDKENLRDDLGPVWLTDISVPDSHGGKSCYAFDYQLRPIRDQPGADQTLAWLDVPTKETAQCSQT